MPFAPCRSPAAVGSFISRVTTLREEETGTLWEPKTLSRLERMALVMGSATAVSEHLARPHYAEATDDNGRTPLMLAASYGHVALCRSLIEAGTNPGQVDARGFDAMAHARRACHTPIVEFLSEILAQQPNTTLAADEPTNEVSRTETDVAHDEAWELSTFAHEESLQPPPDQPIVDRARELQNLLTSHVVVTELPVLEMGDEILSSVSADDATSARSAERVADTRYKLDRILAATPGAGWLAANVACRGSGNAQRPEWKVTAQAIALFEHLPPMPTEAETLFERISSLDLTAEFLDELCIELTGSDLDHDSMKKVADCIRAYDSAKRNLWRQYIADARRDAGGNMPSS